MQTETNIPNLSKQAFWDTDMAKLDYNKNANSIIEAVFQFGTLTDVAEVMRYYGIEKCKYAIINARFLRMSGINVASLLLDIPRTNIKCFTTRPSHLPF